MTRVFSSLILVLFCSLTLNAFPNINLEDFPAVRIELGSLASLTSEQMKKQMDTALLASFDKLQAPILHDQLKAIGTIAIAGGLTEEKTTLTAKSWGYIGTSDHGATGHVQVFAGGSVSDVIESLYYELFLDKTYALYMPLHFRITLAHELAHMIQFMAIESKFGSKEAYEKLTDPKFLKDFLKFTNVTAAATELNGYRSIPAQELIQEIKDSPYDEQKKLQSISRIEAIYKMGTLEYIKYQTNREYCGTKPGCISDAEYETMFQVLRKQGFDFL